MSNRLQPGRGRCGVVLPGGTRRSSWTAFALLLALVLDRGVSGAQELVANDDRYGIPYGLALEVEPFGVLENDLLDGENAGEGGATAVLVSDVSSGSLTFSDDGSFTYEPGEDFPGTDSFVYRAEFGAASSEATVLLSACDLGPEFISCWHEDAFLGEVAALGYSTFVESFEDDAVWGGVRTPDSAPSVASQGIVWTSNHPDPPAENPISTTSGPPRTGEWAVYDPEHGYATGTPTECDTDNPPEHCLYYDGFSGAREAGVLYGVGGYVNGIFGANVAILIDDSPPLGGGKISSAHQFFGVIDPSGFVRFEFRELDGKVGQALFIWGDDFTLVTDEVVSAPMTGPDPFQLRILPNPVREGASLRFALQEEARIDLSIFDAGGRVVRQLVHERLGPGDRVLPWDGTDRFGNRLPAGVYFARMRVHGKDRAGATIVLVE